MAITFTGTNTGKTYVAGQTYSNGNGTYRANADGTFTRQSNGGKTVGSSQSSSTVWGTTSTGALGSGAAGRAAAIVYESRSLSGSGGGKRPASAGGVSGSGAGKPGAVGGGGGAPGAGPGNPGAVAKPSVGSVLGGGFLSGQPEGGIVPPWTTGNVLNPAKVEATQIFEKGVARPRDPGTSDVGDVEQMYGEADDPWSPGFIPAWQTAINHFDYELSQTWAWGAVQDFRNAAGDRWEEAGKNGAVAWEGMIVPPTGQPYARPADPYGFSNPRFGQ